MVEAEGTIVRVGILYRGKGAIESLRIVHGRIEDALIELGSLDDVEKWMEEMARGGNRDRDTSYLAYFYRCLEEDVAWYYLYEAGIGWKVGSTLRDMPVQGRLVPLADWIHWKVQRGAEGT